MPGCHCAHFFISIIAWSNYIWEEEHQTQSRKWRSPALNAKKHFGLFFMLLVLMLQFRMSGKIILNTLALIRWWWSDTLK